MVRVVLDPGHGGRDPGAGANGLREKDITLQVAKLLADELSASGHVVYQTRRYDVHHMLEYRAKFANNWKADLFVSLHCNAAARPEVEGMEVFSFPGSVAGGDLADALARQLGVHFDLRDESLPEQGEWMRPVHHWRGLKEANFAVLRLTNMPAVLVEMEFITNPKQAANLADPAWQLRMAKALAAGIGGA